MRDVAIVFYPSLSSQPDMCNVLWAWKDRLPEPSHRTFEEARAELLRSMERERDRWNEAIDRIAALREDDLNVIPGDPDFDEAED